MGENAIAAAGDPARGEVSRIETTPVTFRPFLSRWVPALAALSLATGLPAAAAVRRPNIIFILTDDLRWNTLGCMGNPIVQTPAIDRLAAQGVMFRNQFCTTAICCVSRASIFSGQHERRHSISDFVTPFTPAQWAQTYPMRLRQAGYRTGFIGKFGVDHDEAPVAAKADEFDYWRGLPRQAGALFIDPKDPTKTHATARFGDQALEFLDGCDANIPFCLSISFNAPHARDKKPREFQPDLRDEALYADVTIPLPPAATEAFYRRLPDFVQRSEGRDRWKARFATPEMAQATLRDYYRLVTGIDREVERIVARLTKKGVTENTIVIFTSDNGFFLGDRGLADKWLMYEESIRLPLIIYDPRLPAARCGTTVDAMTLNIDLAPTMLAMAGVPVPPTMQGRDLAPLLAGRRPESWRTDFFYEHHFGPPQYQIPPSEGVRTERWSYIRWIAANPVTEELYDLSSDPLETRNLAPNPEFAAELARLRARWAFLRQDLK